MIAQGVMAFNSLHSTIADPYSVPQMLVTLKPFNDAALLSAVQAALQPDGETDQKALK
jgi:hypothetical protein